MKNIFITAALLLTAATYAQVTISQESNIADAMEYKKEVARSETKPYSMLKINTNNILPCSLSSLLTTKCALVASAHA